jgi:hypothetical protein
VAGSRKAPGAPEISIRLSSALVEQVDAWARAHDATRVDAVHALVQSGLKAKDRRSAAPQLRDRAAALAGQQLDRMGDTGASTEERASRKSRLADGPSAFREVRRDRPKRKTGG